MTVPNSSSSARSALDSAGWVMWHASAARPKWRCSVSAARYRIEGSRVMPAAPEGSGFPADGDRRELAREIACPERHLHGPVARHLLVDLRGFAIGLGHHGGLAAVGLQADLQRKGQCAQVRSEEHTSELQSPCNLVCRLLLEKKKHMRSHWCTC